MNAADLTEAAIKAKGAEAGQVVYFPIDRNGTVTTFYILSLDENLQVLGVDVGKSASDVWVREPHKNKD